MISSPMPLNGLFYIFITDALGVLEMHQIYFTFTMLSFISVLHMSKTAASTTLIFHKTVTIVKF